MKTPPWYITLIAIVFTGAVFTVINLNNNPTDAQFRIFSVIISIAVGFFAFYMGGQVDLKIEFPRIYIQAVGGIAAFFAIFILLISNFEPEIVNHDGELGNLLDKFANDPNPSFTLILQNEKLRRFNIDSPIQAGNWKNYFTKISQNPSYICLEFTPLVEKITNQVSISLKKDAELIKHNQYPERFSCKLN